MSRRPELDRFCKVFDDHGGLPITDDDLAASALSDLVLDMGFDPIWATSVLVSAIAKVNKTFDRDPAKEIARAMNSHVG